MSKAPSPLTFGVAYYPEHWPRELWESDAQRMRAMGITTVRLMEFSWSRVEPQQGQYDFSLFDDAIETLAGHDLKIVLGTPTATVPAWLVQEHPSVVRCHRNGQSFGWGARREACLNAEPYLQACDALVQSMAEHYGDHERVVGWQIDNEIGHEASDVCVCDCCRARWHTWLASTYGDVDNLNEAWGLRFWGRTVSSWQQVPVPRERFTLQHNPGVQLDYARFCSDTAVGFVRRQQRILREHISADRWISTNAFMPPLGTVIDWGEMFRSLDFVGYDNYPVWGEMDEPLPDIFLAFMLAHIRGLRGSQPFTVFEQFTAPQGHEVLGYRPSVAQAAFWSNHAVAHGAAQVFYFRWRTAPFGQEQLCHGILEPDNEQSDTYRALRDNIAEHGEALGRIANQPFESQACLAYDVDSQRSLTFQPKSTALQYEPAPYLQVGFARELARQYAPFVLLNVNCDVCPVERLALEQYRLLALPLYPMASPQIVEKLSAWVEAGGILLLGYSAGTRDHRNVAIQQRPPGLFAEMAGVRVTSFEALGEGKVGIRYRRCPSSGGVWADVLETTSARVLARYHDRKKPYHGAPCLTVNRKGKGRVYYLGTSLGPVAQLLLHRRALREAGLQPRFYGPGVQVIRRRDEHGQPCDVLLNHNRTGRFVGARWVPGYGLRIVQRADRPARN